MSSLYLNGRLVEATSQETFSNFSPSTGEKICEIRSASSADIEQAVHSSEIAFERWSSISAAKRGQILFNAARILRDRVKELARIEVLDSGKPISEALAVDVISGAEAFEYFAGVAPSLHGSHIDLGSSFVYTRREPLGVCAGIGAWNYPLQIACWKAAPALACGNTMIFKPSELTPLSALRLAEILTEAGVPEGVFNVLQGSTQVGEALSSHSKIRKISLTGSVPTGKKVMQAAAGNLKHVTLELGGKSPLILFGDASLDQAVSAALMANFYTQGEICSNGTRVFVEESIYDAFVDQLIPRVKSIKMGDPLNPDVQMGALISRAHLDKVLKYVELGLNEGARLLCGGISPQWGSQEKHLSGGNYLCPTVFTDCHDKMSIVREEIFGPVMSILKFKSENEVITRANDTSFGLAAGVFTRDIQRAHRVVAQLQAGTCWINNYNITPIEAPFGGYKQSGLGRENSLAAIEHYTQLKSVYVEMGEVTSVF